MRGGELLDYGTVFGVEESLVTDFGRLPAGTKTPDGRPVGANWSKTRFDIILGARETETRQERQAIR